MRSGSRFLLQAALDQYNNGGAGEENPLEKFYRCDLSELPPELCSCFIQLQPDHETRAFLCESKQKSSSICLQLFYMFVHVLLGLFLSLTAINGLLDKGKMFVFSKQQLKKLMSFNGENKPFLVLDIGSGDGHVTDQLKDMLEVSCIHVTEVSMVMQRVLKQKGYSVHGVDSWHAQEGNKYDFISCLNVLDRCSSPLSMLRQMTDNLRVGGLLMIALVHPYEPFVENHSFRSKPTEELPILGESWEEGVASLWREVLEPLGYSPMALSRVPYLCEGDLNTDYYALDDTILILKRTKEI